MTRAKGPELAPLSDFTFFMGAGFSKSWNLAFPSGRELFEVPFVERHQLEYVERAAISNAPSGPAALQIDDVMQLVYSLDMNLRYPAIRARYSDSQNIKQSIGTLRAYFADKLRRSAGAAWSWFDPATNKFQSTGAYTAPQQEILSFFENNFSLVSGDNGFLEGARLNFITTNYDWLIEQIIDAACESDDSAFLYLYRGISADKFCGEAPFIPAFDHYLVFNLLKINGGAEVFRENGRYHFDYRQKAGEDYDFNPPILMLPSREQDYMDD